ncbi:SAM-dependent methyltransferase [Pseudonocardia sp. TRM90224]|uniref:SAM-dependent methyltransferase n=1 Tax=Pseudonocardia sp. TRM90224 TaxID=2812678 RepID=UPI001E561DEA|nr:SAM-dependent methyltransferase [Pseudonocardia sp. TRM90224]
MTEHGPEIRFDVPSAARIWNYWLGGKDNYPVDREVGDAFAQLNPGVFTEARKSREFLVRAVRFLAAEAGIRQFLDVGTGLPTMQNTHEVAQLTAPESKIVYVDNDPIVLAHARALLVNSSPQGVTTYVDADYREPERILAGARAVLDFEQPIAVLFMGVFGYIQDPDEVHTIIEALVGAVPAGSYMALWDGTDTSEAARAAAKAQADLGSPYHQRSPRQIEAWFDGLDLVEPGVVTLTDWRPDAAEVGEAVHIDGYGGVARKP